MTEITRQLLPATPAGPTVTPPGGFAEQLHTLTIPTGANAAFLRVSNPTPGLSTGQNLIVDVQLYDAAGTFLTAAAGVNLAPGQTSGEFQGGSWSSSARYWAAQAHTSDTTAQRVTVDVNFWCSLAGPNNLVTPCCPPDPLLNNLLVQINAKLDELLNAPTAGALPNLKDATRHAGLSGMGTITLVDSCAACRVEIKNLPTSWPQVAQVPPYLWSAGFITSVAVGAPLRGWRLIYEHQTFPLASYADQIGYTLSDGLVVDIVEQLPAP